MISEAPRSKKAATIICIFQSLICSYKCTDFTPLDTWTCPEAVLRSSVMDKVKTIKKEYLPGKLWSGSLSHCFVAILMFLIAAGLISDGCFLIATTRTYKKRNVLMNQSSVRGHEKLDYSTRHLIYLKILTWFEWHLGCQPGLALVTMETPQRDIWWCQQYKT